MEIKQIIIKDDTVFLFTNTPDKDVKILQDAYEKRYEQEFEFPLGYEMPKLTEYRFLGISYPCISLWFDNEDVPDFFINHN